MDEVFERCKSSGFYLSCQENHYTILHLILFFVPLLVEKANFFHLNKKWR